MACAERGAAGIIPYFVPSSQGRTMACAERGAAGIIPYIVPSSRGGTMACAERGAAGIFLILCLHPKEERWHVLRGVLQV